MAFALRLSERMGRTLEELGNTMSSEEFGLRLALELEGRPAQDDSGAGWDSWGD